METTIRHRSTGQRLRLMLLGDVLPTAGLLCVLTLAMVWLNL